jgi:hypothetical protein
MNVFHPEKKHLSHMSGPLSQGAWACLLIALTASLTELLFDGIIVMGHDGTIVVIFVEDFC